MLGKVEHCSVAIMVIVSEGESTKKSSCSSATYKSIDEFGLHDSCIWDVISLPFFILFCVFLWLGASPLFGYSLPSLLASKVFLVDLFSSFD